jgi:hypothetical protein
MQCYKHPKEETGLSCGKCDRPICTKCMVNGPAGVRCRDCASLKGSALYKIAPARLVWAAIVALVLGLAGSMVYSINFFALIVAPLYGGFVGDMVIRAAGRKQGKILQIFAISGIVLGGLSSLFPWVWLFFAGSHRVAAFATSPNGTMMTQMLGMSVIWPIIGMALAISACCGRMRYM